jgi:hypothetical protein
MLLSLIFPLLFSVYIPDKPSFHTVLAELQESHIKVEHTPSLAYIDEQQEIKCSCVLYAHTKRQDIPIIDAEKQTISTTTPFVGAIAKMYYPSSGLYHLSYVKKIDKESNKLLIIESNFESCKITERWISLPNRVIGYF